MRIAAAIVVCLTMSGCARWVPSIQITRQATVYDVEKVEAQIRDEIDTLNQRQSKQWEVLAAHKESLDSTDRLMAEKIGNENAKITRLEESVKHLDVLFWKLIMGAGAAGIVGGVGVNQLRKR